MCEEKIEHITFRKYKNNDYEFVYKIKKNAYEKYVINYWGEWNEKEQKKYFDKFIEAKKNDAYIIQYDNIDIGFYNGNILENGNYEIGNICIIPEYQNKGIGTKIIEEFIALYKNTDIELQCFKINPVKKLYERLGFNTIGETQFHYQMIKLKK
jgi:ribosomal protein S18 acetylase RimI-like enzyme